MSRLPWSAAAAFLLIPTVATAQPPKVRIEAKDHQKITATITYELHTTNFAVNHWTAFMPEPPELAAQRAVKATLTPAGRLIAEKSPLARKVRVIDIPVADPVPGAKLVVRQEIQATLRSRKLVPLKPGEKPPAVTALTSAERKYYLAPAKRIDYDAPTFQGWLDKKGLRRKQTEPPTDYAARVLGVIRSDFEYRFFREDERRASVNCVRPFTDCGGMTFVFVAAMRANDIPARVLVGRLALPREPGSGAGDQGYNQPHVRAELYVAGVGWVPVDPAYAQADHRKPVREFVGYDPGDMLVQHLDLDLRLPMTDQERVAELMQIGPFFWVTGLGPMDAAFGPSGWVVKTTPAGAQ